MRRLPLASERPVVIFALTRLALVAVSLGGLLAIGYPARSGVVLLSALVSLPWSLAMVALARLAPRVALYPVVAAVDVALLVAAQALAPELYGAVRFLALFVIVTHADFQADRGLPIAGAAVATMIGVSVIAGGPLDTETLVLSETLFALSALGASLVVGRLRATESAARLRARDLSRRRLEAENQVRRRVAESIHDGPVQELVGLEMVLASAEAAAARGDAARAAELTGRARELAAGNVQNLRDEIVGLGPYAFEELDLGTAIENCLPVWRRRYGFEVDLDLEPVELPAEVCGALFGIAQEAVANAGRHAGASRVVLRLRRRDGGVELSVNDDGSGFGSVDPLGPGEPGHIGLASMRERAEVLDGELEIQPGSSGTTVTARLPLVGGGGRLRRAALDRLGLARARR